MTFAVLTKQKKDEKMVNSVVKVSSIITDKEENVKENEHQYKAMSKLQVRSFISQKQSNIDEISSHNQIDYLMAVGPFNSKIASSYKKHFTQ